MIDILFILFYYTGIIIEMNYCLIFAGGRGTRMGSETPKQFIVVKNKPIIVQTISKFENSPCIDKIIVVTIKEYIPLIWQYAKKFKLNKIIDVVEGGDSAFESQFNGLYALTKKHFANENDIVFIHDGVRPLINESTIEKCLKLAKKNGAVVTVSPATETISVLNGDSEIDTIVPRQQCVLARAPQVFKVGLIMDAHFRAKSEQKTYIDSASMLLDQGNHLDIVVGPAENIKITTQYDLMLYKMWMNKDDKNRRR